MSGPLVSASAAFVAKNSRIPSYAIEQSLRFDGSEYIDYSDTAFGNEIGTYSFWVKRSELGVENTILWNTRVGGHWGFRFNGNNTFTLFKTQSGTDSATTTAAVFRDPSAWYHILVTTTSTANEIFVNGTSLATGSYEWAWIDANPRIGYRSSTSNFHGYLAEWHYISGSVKTVSDFTETDDNGVLRPIEYEGSYGTNGYYLKFDPSLTNGILHDSSGQGNHFGSSTGITTSGTGTDVMDDTPTTNWCTFNPLNSNGGTLSNGNLDASGTSNLFQSTIMVNSGKYYFEFTKNANGDNQFGIAYGGDIAATDAFRRAWRDNNGTPQWLTDGATAGSGTPESCAANDVVGVALDMDNNAVYFSKNGTYMNSGDPTSGSSKTGAIWTDLAGQSWGPMASANANGLNCTLNCGQREFAYPPGTASATSYFNTVTYTGNGSSSRAITGVGFEPDLVWIKNRDITDHHAIFDSVRGALNYMSSNRTNAEASLADSLTSFDSDGFTLGSANLINYNSQRYVAWCWKAGGTAVTNNDGSASSQVSANQDAGFSVVTYTGQSSNFTWGHGLGVAPSMVIIKRRNTAAGWSVYHTSIGATKRLQLDQSGGTETMSYFQNTEPTSTVFSVTTNGGVGGDGDTYVAYCFAEKSGLSKFGSYTGNGSSTGPFVECGFKPRFVMLKRTDSTSDWFMYDTIRGTNNKLYAETDTAENAEDGGSTSSNTILSLSNGFQLTSGNGSNSSGGTYIFMAFAENFSADATYKALNTANLSAPSIKDGSKYFGTLLYTADNSSGKTVTGLNFGAAPDFVWIKNRDNVESHHLMDIVRGNDAFLFSNNTNQEQDKPLNDTNDTTDFDFVTDGFSFVSTNYNQGELYFNNRTYVGWNWLAGGSGSNNTAGSITSTVSANPTAGFSIVTYTGNGTAGATVGHGLGVAPEFIVVKQRSSSTVNKNWCVYHTALGNTKVLLLNQTAAQATTSDCWNDSGPSSSTFTLGPGADAYATQTNVDTKDYVAYCFAEVEGYSKFGSYTGNNSSDGAFVYTGFAPAFVMIKANESTNWVIYDTSRSPYNVADEQLSPNTGGAEVTNDGNADLLSNGFKLRNGAATTNAYTYVYAAFAENPFGGSGVSPATAR